MSLLFLLHAAPVLAGQEAAEGVRGPGVKAILEKLGVALKVTERPPWPRAAVSSLEVTLLPQDGPGSHVVSFGLPFGPGVLQDDARIHVIGSGGREVPTFTRPLVHWWLDRKKGSLRSVLIQFEMAFPDAAPRKVVVTWSERRRESRPAMTPVGRTQTSLHVDPPRDFRRHADSFDYQCPKVLALLPPEWLCASLLVWQQAPARANEVAPWFDKHLLDQFGGSLRWISANRSRFEAHLFDRPATYLKVYARHGEAGHLRAALQAGDFYVQHIGPDGFFDVKRQKDHKYVYTEGPAVLYMLTGDERYRAAVDRALKSWDRWTSIEYRGRGFWTERHHGFGMMAYLHAYELTGERKHLDKAKRYFEAAYNMQVRPADGKEPDGAWVHSARSHGDGRGWTTSPWMSSFLTDAIYKYWMLSGDPRAPVSLAMYAKFTEKHAVTPDGRGVYYMANSPARGRSTKRESPPHNMEAVYHLAMGYYLSGGTDAGMREKIETLWPPMMRDQANVPGRKFNWRFRETSMLVWFLAEAEVIRRGERDAVARRAEKERKPVAPRPVPRSDPLAPYADSLRIPLQDFREGRFDDAAALFQALWESIDEDGARRIVAGYRKAAESGKLLRATIVSRLKEGRRVRAYVDVAGSPQRVRPEAGDEKGLTVAWQGTEIPVAWESLRPERFCQIASSYVSAESAREQKALAFYAAACGDAETARWTFAAAAELDAEVKDEEAELDALLGHSQRSARE